MPTLKLLTLLSAFILLLSACNGGNGEEAGGDDPEDPEAAESVEEAEEREEEAEAAGDTVIRFWHAFGGERELWVAEKAEEYSEATDGVAIVPQYRGTYQETLDAAILAAGTGSAPHIVQMYEIGTQVSLDSGIFKPVAEADTEGRFDADDYLDAVIGYYTIDGQINSVPWNSSNPILYVNRGMLEEAGLDPDSPPQSYDEMLDACEQIVESDVAEACLGMPLHSWFFEQWLAQQGATLANNGNGRDDRATEVVLDSPEAVATAEWWKEMYDRGFYVYSGAREDWDDANTLFLEEQVAFSITSTSDVGFYTRSAEEAGIDLDTAFMPVPDDGARNGTVIGGASLWLMDGHSEEEEAAALDFMLWLSSPEIDAEWHQFTGYFPVRDETVDLLEQEGWFEEEEDFATAVQQLEETEVNEATRGAVIGPFPEVRSIVLDAMEQILLNDVPAEEALADASAAADRALEDYNRSVD